MICQRAQWNRQDFRILLKSSEGESYLVLSGDGLDEAHREVSYFPMGEREVKVPVSNV